MRYSGVPPLTGSRSARTYARPGDGRSACGHRHLPKEWWPAGSWTVTGKTGHRARG
jgi:hypothetical protein